SHRERRSKRGSRRFPEDARRHASQGARVKRPVRVLRRAQLDLLEIQAYLLRDDPAATTRLIDQLVAELERLATFSSRGARPRDERLRKAGYRYVVRGQSLIFFEVLGRKSTRLT